MGEIVYETVTGSGIEQCKGLCNELMAFQKSKALMMPEIFDSMNFDTRMKSSYEKTPDSHVVVAKSGGVPVAYVFSTIESVERGDKSTFPDWAPKTSDCLGFYPEWSVLPKRCGCLNNIYVRDEFKRKGIGLALFNSAMDWIKEFSDINIVFVYISNGNDAAFDFYINRGFTYSHDVFGGFIKAAFYRFR